MENESAQIMTIVSNIVRQHGCSIVNVDIENHIIELDGAEENQEACALALAEVLD